MRVASLRDFEDTYNVNVFQQAYDTITGNVRNYGYEWKFTILVGVYDKDEIRLGDAVAARVGQR